MTKAAEKMINTNTTDHWQSYYSLSKSTPTIPSQFAAFVASEYAANAQIFDLGCGNGRDSLFFASLGNAVVGIDGSHAAIERCNAQASSKPNIAAKFLQSEIESQELANVLIRERTPATKVLAYARFFLHAITDEQETSFLNSVKKLCSQPGDIFALEFRTERDIALPKVTPDHYRRFINPIDTIAATTKLGFKVIYFVEGFGYAKYKSDDAYVARLVLQNEI
jgi:SAM-dependent methyltransferase